jgi:RNA polymerase sigma factor (sigma-70 family)
MATPATESIPLLTGSTTVSAMTERIDRLLANLDLFTSFVRRRVGDAEVAADVVQDALRKAISHIEQVEDDRRLDAWFYRILRNTCADVMARRAAARHVEPLPEELADLPAEEQRTACACLDGAIAELPPSYAEVLRAVDLAGGDATAVSERLGISTTNLKVRRLRAREALREVLELTCRVCATHGCVDCHCASGSSHGEHG